MTLFVIIACGVALGIALAPYALRVAGCVLALLILLALGAGLMLLSDWWIYHGGDLGGAFAAIALLAWLYECGACRQRGAAVTGLYRQHAIGH
jgi:hypothetical protein